jgi:hypothetical protein
VHNASDVGLLLIDDKTRDGVPVGTLVFKGQSDKTTDEGPKVGNLLLSKTGFKVGEREGLTVSTPLGQSKNENDTDPNVGILERSTVGTPVGTNELTTPLETSHDKPEGLKVGRRRGEADGEVGTAVGTPVGSPEGLADGEVGTAVGTPVGSPEG